MKLLELLKELKSVNFNNWVMPSEEVLKREFYVEHTRKGRMWWPSEEVFLDCVRKGVPTIITKETDKLIKSRSRTQSKEDLLDLISSYASYPEYRNEQTLDGLYKAFEQNKPMEMPIVVKDKGSRMIVFSGNTRMDVAFQMGINPKVLVIKNKKQLPFLLR